MQTIDVPQTISLLLSLSQTLMPFLLVSLPILIYMNFVNGQFAKLGKPVLIEVAADATPARAKPCHYTASALVPPPPPLAQ